MRATQKVQANPAYQLGCWLRNIRRAKGICATTISLTIDLSTSKYAETELGVGHWLTVSHLYSLCDVLSLNQKQITKLWSLWEASRRGHALVIKDLFTRAQMPPILIRIDGKYVKPTPAQRKKILDAIVKSA